MFYLNSEKTKGFVVSIGRPQSIFNEEDVTTEHCVCSLSRLVDNGFIEDLKNLENQY